MERRRFLSTTMLTGLGLGFAATRADALTMRSCTPQAADPACAELVRHKTMLAQLDSMLRAKGLNDAQRQAVLAKAVCPFCGQLLIG